MNESLFQEWAAIAKRVRENPKLRHEHEKLMLAVAKFLRDLDEEIERVERVTNWRLVAVLVWSDGVSEPIPSAVEPLWQLVVKIDTALGKVKALLQVEDQPSHGRLPNDSAEVNALAFAALRDRWRRFLHQDPAFRLFASYIVLRTLPELPVDVEAIAAQNLSAAKALAGVDGD